MDDGSVQALQFAPFLSTIENGFWTKLADLKLNVFKLDDSKKSLKGFYCNSDVEGLLCRHSLEYSAFEIDDKVPPLCFLSHGNLHNTNTVESFKGLNHTSLLEQEAQMIWNSITNGDAIYKPDKLVRFLLLTYADLKKFVFHYWFAFPAFVHPSPITVHANHSMTLAKATSTKFMKSLQNLYDRFCSKSGYQGFFLISGISTSLTDASIGSDIQLHKLQEIDYLLENSINITFAFCDPSTLDEHPGWPLRNYLSLIAFHWAKKVNEVVNVLCYRDRTQGGKRCIGHSLFLRINLKTIPLCPENVTGWEKNRKNKFGPRSVNLANSMDPIKLAESSVNLNLKLMRWRLMPSLNLENIAATKCLLLGSGTLGCNVARGLLAWGVSTITLVDNGKVSFSNPIRQSLFEFSDCGAGGGRLKAIAAAEKLKKIFPSVAATGVELSIPMPGHPSRDVGKVKQDIEKLEHLIDTHDIVFLLMDTRESRWLPTLLAGVKQKLVINVALGFDSYLVMRHGLHNKTVGENVMQKDSSPQIGCYFCNDVVAPGNSMHDRTLDQQCTVTRPGVSMIAAALAVELMVSLLQHPAGINAYPDGEIDLNSENQGFGIVPHQIRGFLSQGKIFYPTTEAFSQCTGCSKVVLDSYKSKGFNFLLDVFNSTHHFLEDLTGLTLLHQQTSQAEADILEFSDSESI